MPLVPAVGFEEPHGDEKLWRYLDLSKYLNMLTTGGLWFSRADLLGDPFEGSTTTLTKQQLITFAQSMVPDGEDAEIIRTRIIDEQDDMRNFLRTHTYINSWHINDGESEAMWRLYSKDFGIAIVSTLNQMKNNLYGKKEFIGGRVLYINYENEVIPNGNFFGPYIHKRKSFEHEREFRLICIPQGQDYVDFFENPMTLVELMATAQDGVLVPIDLNGLISVVHVTPTSPDWYFESVREISKKLGFTFEVKRSSLDIGTSSPIF